MNNIETMKLALEALKAIDEAMPFPVAKHAIKQLRQAIEQAQQAEPDYYGLTRDHLWMSITKDHHDRLKPEFRMACYTAPPPRQPLTDEEMFTIAKKIGFDSELMKLNHDRGMPSLAEQFARAIEAAHGIKGGSMTKHIEHSLNQDKMHIVMPEQPKVRTGNCLRVGVCASEGHKIAPPRQWVGLTDEDHNEILLDAIRHKWLDRLIVKQIEAKLKEKNT